MPNNVEKIDRKKLLLRKSFILGIVLMIVVLCFAGYLVAEHPRYLTLPKPSPILEITESTTGRLVWVFSEFSTRVYTDGSDRYFILRREADAYGSFQNFDFNSLDGVVEYFDDWLKSQGWVRVDKFGHCVLLAEEELISEEEGVYIEYRKKGVDHYDIEPSVCLAVWGIPNSVETKHYNVVIQTANPSFFTKLRDW